MTNSGMGISAPVTGNKEDVTIEAISTTDSMDTIPYEQCWRIMKSDQNYMLRNGNRGGSGYLTSSASDIAGKQVTADSYTSGYSEWELIPYEGSDLQGIVLVEKPTEILCGNSFDFDAFMFSSVIGCNGPVEYSIGSYGNTITDTASINSTTGNLHALDIGEVEVRFNFDGCPLTWGYTIDIVQAGCRTYRYIEAGSTESYNINCHGYAFGVDDVPGGWYTYAEDLFATYSTISSNELLYGLDAFSGMKALLEIYWLDEVFSGRWEEVYSYDDGWDIELDDNQWLVVFRVGKHGTAWDYHFWYRTDTGKWANKHGWLNGSGSELLGDMPSDDASPGWAAGVYEFYDSDIIYYVVTMED